MLLAQNDNVIEQARLRSEPPPSVSAGADANGTALAEAEPSSSSDDSLGAQRIMKAQEPIRNFTLTGGLSLVYTDNVALTRSGERSDFFGVAAVGLNWTPHLAKNFDGNFSFNTAIFRYDRTSELDFENLSLGVGISYTIPNANGLIAFARYDLTELLDRDGGQIVTDHGFSLGLQKTIPLGRSHALGLGLIGTLGLSDPSVAQRSQIGGFAGYQLQLTRNLGVDFLTRPVVYFYTKSDRTDFNQIFSCSLRYRFSNWADANASFSYGVNRSDRSVFDYDVLTTGATVGLTIRF